MMSLKMLSLMAAALLIGAQGFAQESEEAGETTMTIEDAKDQPNKVDGEQDMDDVITNRKMRAEAGSKSKYSASASLNYSGGSIEKPLAEDRPNITGALGTTLKANATADVSARYRMTPTQSLSAGLGIRWVAPLETDGVEADERTGEVQDRVDASNPYVSYNNVYKWAGIQSVFSAGVTLITNNDLRNAGYVSTYSVSQNNIYNIGTTGLGVGLLLSAGSGTYDKGGALKAAQYEYYVGAYPFLEYVINDTFNLRTISGVWVYEHSRAEADPFTFSKNGIYQSVGLGISVTRDIFLYPNIQFMPEDIRSDRTNVAMSATINVF